VPGLGFERSPSLCCQEQATHPHQVEKKQGKFFGLGVLHLFLPESAHDSLLPAARGDDQQSSRSTSPPLLNSRDKENLSGHLLTGNSEKVIVPEGIEPFLLNSATTGHKAPEQEVYVPCRASFPWACTQAGVHTVDVCSSS